MHFGVVERPLKLPEADDSWSEQPVGTHPQKTFCDVSAGHGGMMIANRGLPEYEVLDTPDGATIALTLLRSVGWLSRFDFPSRKGGAGPHLETPGAQLLGVNVAEYSIIPHREGWENGYAQAHAFAAPMRARWNRQGTGVLPGAGSLLELEGDGLVVTALKRPEGVEQDGETILRLYNILDEQTSGRVRLAEPSAQVDVVTMNEELIAPANVDDGWVQLSLKPNEIVTLRFETSS
jgi:alpha-mannosidase